MELITNLKTRPLSLSKLYSNYSENDLLAALVKISSSPNEFYNLKDNTTYFENVSNIIENIYLKRYLGKSKTKSNMNSNTQNISKLISYLNGLDEKYAVSQ